MDEQNRNSRIQMRDGSEGPIAPSGGAMSMRFRELQRPRIQKRDCGISSPHMVTANSIPNVFIQGSFIVYTSGFAHKPSACPTSPKAILASMRHAPEAGLGDF